MRHRAAASMARVAPFLCTILSMLAPAPAVQGQENPFLPQMLVALGREASQFWSGAPGYVGKETWREKYTYVKQPGRRFFRTGADALKKPQTVNAVHEVVSYYAVAPFRRSPESLFEFRRVISIDGKATGEADREREEFIGGLRDGGDKWRHKLRDAFEEQTMAGVMVDFGQLIMLFTKHGQKQFEFSLKGAERSGADTAVLLHFEQQKGKQALRVTDSGNERDTPLKGEILLRDPDYAVLQIRLSSARTEEGRKVRDEAQVDYTRNSAHAILPASVTHRRYLDGKLDYEDVFEYSDWAQIGDEGTRARAKE